ncbi:PASTA domain-containing protein [Bittarella massiliensis (ex Durand et al. 2017)]|uniref:PASTA domain-containing protein n=1 Tax=Bittarella massiliensis (ex Durand et al. 2017) TaxID=1720313 RepID=A0AAW5KCM9_9FIRM|nr:PASTA domain-containing protein [Bittarella massiliensis (ex Durand et al. 2017)]MCQ4950313.1 PASTA domain-containing protein [Bittarella massiliensis (ex Durand et al. 2017)]
MNIDTNLCIHCMTPLEEGRCPRCHIDQNTPNPHPALPVHTVVAGRFLLGQVIHMDGEGIDYQGYDCQEERRVTVRELFPTGLVDREFNGSAGVAVGESMHFKTVVESFVDLYKSLAHIEAAEALCQVYGVWKDRGTVYAVTEHFDGISLSVVLSRTIGEIDSAATLNILKPFFKTLREIHKLGMVHGGICPDNILVNGEGEVRLVGFATSALRTKGSELQCELFPGYSAPEQYSVTGWQGSWTDIYAVGATIYRCITGTRPQSADERLTADALLPPIEVNHTVDSRLSQAVAAALVLPSKGRIRTIEEFATALLPRQVPTPSEAPTKEAVRITDEEEPRPAAQSPKKGGKDSGGNKKFIWMIAGIAAALVIVGAAIAVWLYTRPTEDPAGGSSSTPSSSTTSSEETKEIIVPSVIGKPLTEFKNEYDDIPYRVVTEYSSEYDKDVICNLSPKAGEVLKEGEILTITVSSGPESIDMPDIVGKSWNTVKSELDSKKIQYTMTPSYTGDQAIGTVVYSSVEAGTKIVPGNTKNSVKVSIMVRQEKAN